MSYLDHPENLLQDTKQFLSSEYGKYFTDTLSEMIDGVLSEATARDQTDRDWLAGYYKAFQEVKDLIHAPLDDDKTPRG